MSRKQTTENHSIAAAAIFAHCTPKQRRRLEQLATPIEVRAGYALTHEGAIGHEFGVISEGKAVVTVEGRQVAVLGPGDHYGEVALLEEIGHTHGRRMATVTAETNLWVSVMSVAEFRTLLLEFPDVADAVRRAARDRVGAGTH
jgi:CRP/FNR family transcriptional regulator, cyclic AMP receptor protein